MIIAEQCRDPKMAKLRLSSNHSNTCYKESKIRPRLKEKFRQFCTHTFSTVTLLFILSCAAQETIHGNQIDKIDIDKIQIGFTSKKDLQLILGPPSFRGSFDSGNLYYSNVKRQSPLGRQAVINSSELFAFSFDENDVLLEMNRLQELPNSVDYESDKTTAPGVSLGILEQIFFNLQRRQGTE